jgi:SpoVK/Ycf46/Vps4 family AAA+-type ATPase
MSDETPSEEPISLRQLNLQYLNLQVARMERFVDAALATHYGPNTIQFNDIAHRHGAEAPLDTIQAELQTLAQQSAAIDEEVRERGGMIPLLELITAAALNPLETQLLLLALAPVLDASFRKRIALLQDNILKTRIDVDIALRLCTRGRLEQLNAHALLSPDGALRTAKLIQLKAPPEAGDGCVPLVAHELQIPARVESHIMGEDAIDASIAPFCRVELPLKQIEQVVLPEDDMESITGLLNHYATWRDDAEKLGLRDVLPVGRSLVLQITGPPGTGKSLLVEAISTSLGRRLITVEGTKLAQEDKRFDEYVDKLFFEARQRGAILTIDGSEAVFSRKSPRASALYHHFERHEGIVFLVTNDPGDLDFSLERWVAWQLKIETPEPALRERIWNLHLPHGSPLADDVDVKGLAQQFEFTGSQIRNATLVALNRAMTQSEGSVLIDQAMLESSSHAQLRADMDEVSVRSRVQLTLDDIVLPEDERALVGEVLDACRVRNHVMTHWGFGQRLTTGRGLCILFSGEPGTGKTLCAEIISSELGTPIHRISIPRIMSKWMGETEKNIAKIFSKARASHSMLLFDEADSLFTSRVDVESSVDRFANMETNLLLQEIERFEGICVLTTNHEKNIDEAFRRRIQFRITFPFPDAKQRAQIWKTLVPKECPIEEGIAFDLLGENFELSGGYIKNAILRAAYRAAAANESISMNHIQDAAEQECRNAGKIFRSVEPTRLGGYL